MPLKKFQLRKGLQDLATDVDVSGYDSHPNSNYGALKKNLEGAINRCYGRGFVSLDDDHEMDLDVEEAYNALMEGIRSSDIARESVRIKKVRVQG